MFAQLFRFLQENADMEAVFTVLSRLFVMLICFPVHECAHAWTAYMLGDPTAKRQGRLTLNPFRHLDLIGSFMILLMGFGYAKPVPINPSYFRNRKRDMAVSAFAGPFSNMIMAAVFLWCVRLLTMDTGTDPALWRLMMYAAYINVSLAVFNLLPISPLDGSKVLGILLPDKIYKRLLNNGRNMIFLLIFGILILNRMGYSPVGAVTSGVFDYLYRWIVMVPSG